MAIADANYRFIYADVGVNGRIGDAGIWIKSDLKYAIEKNEVCIPKSINLPLTETPSPFTLISDDAFALTEYNMKPFSHKNLNTDEITFNYMLSRNRRVVENAFGILANRFQVLFLSIYREPVEAIKVVLACVCLHSFLRTDNINKSTNYDVIEENEMDKIIIENYTSNRNSNRSERYNKSAQEIRFTLKDYFKNLKLKLKKC